MATFRIATFVNDEGQYAAMRSSFETAGFSAPLVRFTVEEGEPYAGITRLGRSEEPYVLLIHQDVRCDWGETPESLQARLAELTAADPDWTVAGNAGGSPPSFRARLEELTGADLARIAPGGRGLNPVRHISDPHGTTWASGLPRRVLALDENTLILRTERRPACSAELSGWHLYGADLVLNAEVKGGTAYVIDFRLTHLSGGKTEGYEESKRRLFEHWEIRAGGG